MFSESVLANLRSQMSLGQSTHTADAYPVSLERSLRARQPHPALVARAAISPEQWMPAAGTRSPRRRALGDDNPATRGRPDGFPSLRDCLPELAEPFTGSRFVRGVPRLRDISRQSLLKARAYSSRAAFSQRRPPQVRSSWDSPSMRYQRGNLAVSSGGPASSSVSPWATLR